MLQFGHTVKALFTVCPRYSTRQSLRHTANTHSPVVWRLKEGDEDKVDTVHVTAYKLDPLCAYLTPRARN